MVGTEWKDCLEGECGLAGTGPTVQTIPWVEKREVGRYGSEQLASREETTQTWTCRFACVFFLWPRQALKPQVVHFHRCKLSLMTLTIIFIALRTKESEISPDLW